MKPLKVRNLTIDPPLILAPMSGITGAEFRQFIRELNPGAVGLYYSEFSSIEGLVRNNRPSQCLIRPAEDDRKTLFAAQLFGKNPENMAWAAQKAMALGADMVDINCGCPAPKVIKKGGGSELLRNLPLLGEILEKVRAAIQAPLAVKIRTGWDEASVNALETAKVVQESGADLLTVHGRTRMQAFKGEADWEIIRRIKESVSIPVAGNGDVSDPETAGKRFLESGVDAIMIGRGALKDPWLFRRTKEMAGRNNVFEPSVEEKLGIFLRYTELLEAGGLPQKSVLGKMKQLCVKFLKGKPHAAVHRTGALRSETMEAFIGHVRNYFEN